MPSCTAGGGTERTPFSGPIIFTVFGLVFGPIGLGFLDVTVDTQMLRYIADVTLALVTWVAFGAAVVGPFYEHFSCKVIVFAILSLTHIRMLPIFLSLTGTGDSTEGKLFVGWFGPRGLASIVFVIIVLGNDLPGAAPSP